MKRLILLALNKLDQEPRDDDGDVRGGALGGPALGDGVVRVHIGEFGLSRKPRLIGTPEILLRL